jgi:predicted acyltransferase
MFSVFVVSWVFVTAGYCQARFVHGKPGQTETWLWFALFAAIFTFGTVALRVAVDFEIAVRLKAEAAR